MRVCDTGTIIVECEKCGKHAGGDSGFTVAKGGAVWSKYDKEIPSVSGRYCDGMLCPVCTLEWEQIVEKFWFKPDFKVVA